MGSAPPAPWGRVGSSPAPCVCVGGIPVIAVGDLGPASAGFTLSRAHGEDTFPTAVRGGRGSFPSAALGGEGNTLFSLSVHKDHQ